MADMVIADNLSAAEQNGTPAQQAGLTAERYREITAEIREQPAWRVEADKAADYYDGNVIDDELAQQLQERGMGPIHANIIKPTIDVILGMEAKARTDWRVIADHDKDQEVCEALSAKLHEAERNSRSDRACADAYAGMIKSGLGWVGVTREPNPFKYPYRVETIHRREMFWDWQAKAPDLSDANYLTRQRWFGLDQLCTFLPEHKEILSAVGNGWPTEWLDRARESVSLQHSFDQERRISLGDWEWRSTQKRRLCLHEVWYREYVRGLVVELPDGNTVELDKKNIVQMAAIGQGLATPRPAVYSRLHVSLWVGPHKLEDHLYGTGLLPYVPFWGFREDLTGVPYGMTRSMMPLQDEYDARRRKLLWLLASKRIMVDSDALDQRFNDYSDLAREVARPDSVVVLNPNRKNANGIAIETDLALASQQYEVMMECKAAIQEVAGVYNAMLGRSDKATSGLAINSLVEQGTTNLAEINDNFRFARNLVGEALCRLIAEDLSGGTNVEVLAGEQDAKRRKIVLLNAPKIDDTTGLQYKHNDVSKAQWRVSLEDVPSTPSYRAQQMTMMAEVVKGLGPDQQAVLMPSFVELTELPKRKELAQLLRQQMGLTSPDGGEVDPATAQLQQQLQEMQQLAQQGEAQYQQMIGELQQKLQDAEFKNKEASALLKNKEAENQLRLLEQDQKLQDNQRITNDENRRHDLEMERVMLERERMAIEQAKSDREFEHKRFELQSQHEAAAMAPPPPEPEKRDEAAELQKLTAAMEKLIAPVAKELEAIKKGVEEDRKADKMEAPAPAPAPIINVTVDAKTGEVKKSITVKRDASGNMTGAEVTEQ